MVSREVACAILKRWEDSRTLLDFIEVEPHGSSNSIGKSTWPVRVKTASPDGAQFVSLMTPKERSLEFSSDCVFEYKTPNNEQFTRVFPGEYGNALEIDFPDGRVVFLAEHPDE